MREIKFKLWDKRRGKWLSDYSISSYDEILDLYEELDCKREDTILVQYTGLKDKNGAEIYEGDILKHESLTHQETVEWKKNMWTEEGFMTGYGEWFGTSNQYEITGNIYENSELINV